MIDNLPRIEDVTQTIHPDPATDMASDNPPSIEDMAQTMHPDPATDMVSDRAPSIEDMTQAIHLDPEEVQKQFNRIGRFRILVIGRSNAGKTTLLQRVCKTTELPEIYNSNGEKVKVPHCAVSQIADGPAIRSLIKSCVGH